ncbi:unnamed protein product [Heterobilharzia americana]|nr:unnamed protein product [Heterobilharzia americana]
MKSQQALLSDSELQYTSKVVTEFLHGEGRRLQISLEDFAKSNPHTSYIANMWSQMYLRDRQPVVLTNNSVMVFNNTELGRGYDHPAIRSTNLVYSTIHFYKLLYTSELSPPMYCPKADWSKSAFFRRVMRFAPQAFASNVAHLFNVYPLDTSQFNNMFCSARLPGADCDKLVSFNHSHHLLVIHKGHYYYFDVLDEFGELISPSQLFSNLQFILKQLKLTSPPPPPIGVITTMQRDKAFTTRQRLVDLGNKASLNLIDSALFILALDDETSTNHVNTLPNFLSGSSQSRWFDKSFTLIINQSGYAAINFEHSWGDDAFVSRLFADVYMNSEKYPAVSPSLLENTDSLPQPDVRRIEWILDDNFLLNIIQPSQLAYDEWRNNLTFSCIEKRDSLNRCLCKSAGLDPDSIMQLSFQLAYDTVHGERVAACEPCNTSTFKHGRTETIRSATVETRKFIDLMRIHKKSSISVTSTPISLNDITLSDLFTSLRACSSKHSQLVKEAAMGQGWDRHLFALHQLALGDSQCSLPNLFLDPNYEKINQCLLCTAALSTPGLALSAFAAVCLDGYGITYAIEEDCCGIQVTSWSNSSKASAVQLKDAFSESINHLTKLIEACSVSG